MAGEISSTSVDRRTGDRFSRLFRGAIDAGIGPELPVNGLVFDCLVAALFCGIGTVFLPMFYPHASLLDYIFVALINLPLVVRRRLPRTSFVLVYVFGLAQIWAHSWIGFHDASLLFSLYTLVGLTSRRLGLVGGGIALICVLSGSITGWWGYIDNQLFGGETVTSRIVVTAGMVAVVLTVWASGERLRYTRAGLMALAERTAQLEQEREQQAQIAAAAERSRIAREMHDVIAHALSVMIAQADGGAYVVDQDSDAARQALTRISETGRDSLTQMRGLLGLLRDQGPDTADENKRTGNTGGVEPADRTDRSAPSAAAPASVDHVATPGPQPGLGELSELITQAESSGLRVTVAHQGNPAQASQMIGLTSYRIVQECLSNARRHGGDHVEVTLGFRSDGVDLQVMNDPPCHRQPLQQSNPQGGHGLQGMRERVEAVGGRFQSQQTDVGFEVQVWLPYAPASAVDAVADADIHQQAAIAVQQDDLRR